MGFEGAQPAATGRPSYHPAVLLKIYIYGYLDRIQSSRRLEREAQRNVELMWLTGRLAPDSKTITDFRKDHGDAIRKVCREFVQLCRRLYLFTDGKLQARIEQLEQSIRRYLVELDRADRDASAVLPSRVTHLKEKIAHVKEQMRALGQIGDQMEASEDHQISLTDPDARSMATSGRGTGIVGYNVQTAVDAKHHMIVAHEVTNVGHDRAQLAAMAKLAKQAIGQPKLNEDVLDAVQERLDALPEAARLRRQTVEHVFGTLKSWMGSTHFLTKTLPRVRTEMSLQVLA